MDWFKSIFYLYILPYITYFFFLTLTILYSTLFLCWYLYLIARNYSKKIWKVKHRELPPKCLNDPIFGNHNYVQLKYVKLHYVEAGNKENPLVIFLHGFPDFWYSWRHQIKEFSKDFRTVAVDLRGYGESEKPEGYRYYSKKYICDDIKNLLEALGSEKCILIGHDWGGLITWRFAQKYPEKLEKYVIINAPEQKAYWKYLRSSIDQFIKSWYVFFFQAPYLPEMALRMNDMRVIARMFKTKAGVSFVTEEELEAYKFTFGKPGAFTPPLNYYRFLFKFTILSKTIDTSLIPTISVNGLMIIGDSDTALDKNMLEMCAKEAGGENMKTVIIEDGTHFIQQEKPEEVNKALSSFLREN